MVLQKNIGILVDKSIEVGHRDLKGLAFMWLQKVKWGRDIENAMELELSGMGKLY